MLARSHVDVNERRLRPIYDCLDNGNNKKALQEADKVLKKQKDLLCAKVLKALALLRVGRHDESTDLLAEVHAQSPTEESTLLAMGIAYRELHKLDLIADMYENAHRERPDNEEVLSALFMAYVRLSDYKKQQQTAMKLHRLRPNKNPYYFWAVMSIVMQAHMDKKLAKNMYLPLAERMASKYVAENKVEAEAEVQMYLIVLEQLTKYEEALCIVRGPLGEKLTSDPRFQKAKEAELLVRLERWDEANRAYKRLLIENNDDWSHYKAYFKTAFAMIETKWTPTEENGSCEEPLESADHTVEAVLLFLEGQIQAAMTVAYTPRGPYLAQFLLLQHLRDHDIPTPDSLGSAETLVRQYLAKFGDRPCCFSDLKIFMDLIPVQQVKQIVDDLTTELGLNSQSEELALPRDAKSLQRHLSLLQLAQCSGLHDDMTQAEKLTFSEQLICRYKAGLPLGEDLQSTDIQYSDNYLVLACHTMVDVYLSNGDRSLLWRAIVLLEKALISSPSNFQIKLLLITFYSRLGCCSPCKLLYENMRIRNILNDSMGYIVVNHMCRLGHFSAAASIYGAMLRFFTVNHKDTTEYLTASYKFGSFTKIYEFVLFRERLQNSLQFASATAERLMLDLTQETTSHQDTEHMLSYMEFDPVNDKTEWDELRDNRDLTVMLTWNPPHKMLLKAHIDQSFREEVAWLKVRNLTLRCLAAATSVTERAVPNNVLCKGDAMPKNMADVLRGLMAEFQTHIAECEKSLPTLDYPVCGPSPTRLTSYIKGRYAQCLFEVLDTLFYIQSLREGGFDKADKAREDNMDTITKQLKGHIADACSCVLTSNKDAVTFNPQGLEQWVHAAELLSHVTIVMGACQRMLKPIKSNIVKKNKKKKDNLSPLPQIFGKFNSLVTGLVEVVKKADAGLAAVDVELLSDHMQGMTLANHDSEEDEKLEGELRAHMRLSYDQSLNEVRRLMDTKHTYLSTLTL